MAENPPIAAVEVDIRFDNLEPKSKQTQSCPDLKPRIVAARRNYVSVTSSTSNNDESVVESISGLSNKKFDPVIYISAEAVIQEFQAMKNDQTTSKESINKQNDEKPKPTNVNPKALKEKSASSANIRMGPFATIRENELKRKQKTSLDLEQTEEEG
uniref:Uncharacterized protein n=1 Tax=Acrobeloides nanus TaxID=290746 RepID=A0A914C5M5_9BILA